LDLLARVEVPLVIGEIPDMHEASLYIRTEQIPAPDTLRRANERLHEWAQERKSVFVLPFALWTAQLRNGEMGLPPRLRTRGDERFPSEIVLCPDRLHPSELGQVLLAAWLSNSIEEWLKPRKFDFHLESEVIRDRLNRAGR
jgi:lysophospholipase L1-like esterase